MTAKYDKQGGRRLREIREARGITQAQLAKQSDLGERQYRNLETGQSQLTTMHIHVFASVLDVPETSLSAKVGSPIPRRTRSKRTSESKPA